MNNNQQKKHKCRIAVVTCIDQLSISPSLLNAITILASSGYIVDLIGRKSNKYPTPKFENPNIFLHFSPWVASVGIPGPVYLRHFIVLVHTVLMNRSSVILAVSPEGLVLAGPVAVFFRIPLVHFSLEILFPENRVEWVLKQAEKFFYKYVEFTIIQDAIRAKTQLDSIGLSDAEMVYLPNSSGLKKNEIKNSTYLKRKLDIPEENVIILSAGNFSYFTSAKELAQATINWPENWTFVLHGWADDDKYMEELKLICSGKKNILLSTDFVPYEKLDELVSSAKIGIAFYTPVNRNIYEMATSSGKIWQYLRCGLPIITSALPSLCEMIDEGGFGLYANNPDEIQEAIKKILLNYGVYAEKARSYYKEHGDFAKNFSHVLSRLELIISRKD